MMPYDVIWTGDIHTPDRGSLARFMCGERQDPTRPPPPPTPRIRYRPVQMPRGPQCGGKRAHARRVLLTGAKFTKDELRTETQLEQSDLNGILREFKRAGVLRSETRPSRDRLQRGNKPRAYWVEG